MDLQATVVSIADVGLPSAQVSVDNTAVAVLPLLIDHGASEQADLAKSGGIGIDLPAFQE